MAFGSTCLGLARQLLYIYICVYVSISVCVLVTPSNEDMETNGNRHPDQDSVSGVADRLPWTEASRQAHQANEFWPCAVVPSVRRWRRRFATEAFALPGNEQARQRVNQGCAGQHGKRQVGTSLSDFTAF